MSRNAQYLRFKPRPDSAAPSVADLHFLMYAQGRHWKTVATLTCIRERAAYLIRRRLVHHGLIEPSPHDQPMKLTHATYKLIRRATRFGQINLPADFHSHRKGRSVGG